MVQITGGVTAPKKATTNVNAKFATNFGGAGPGIAAPAGQGTVLKSPAMLQQEQASQPSYGGGGGSYDSGGSSYGGGSGGGGGAVAPMVAPPSEEDYLAGDSGFQAQNSALQQALQRFLSQSDFQKSTYEQDYGKSLRDLGYNEGNKTWNWNDKLTAAGRGYQSQLDDYGNRGMLQSSAYGDAFNELQRMLGQQYETLNTGKQTFMTDLQNQIANYQGDNTAQVQSARADALQRRAAQYSL